MDRLKKDHDHMVAEGMDSGALYKRVCKYLKELIAYRASGLTPEQVAQLKEILGAFNCDAADPAQLKGLFTKLQSFAQAEQAGRLVVLPCKIGDLVYVPAKTSVREFVVDRIYVLVGGGLQIRLRDVVAASEIIRLSGEQFAKKVFLAREDAETAQKGDDDG